MKCKRYIIHGKVQGVFFRAWTRDTALGMGLTGWVRNLPDRTVEALACGEEAALASFEKALGQGPPLSRVTEVQSFDGNEADAPKPFEVRY